MKRSEGWTDRKEGDKMGRGRQGWRENEREGDKDRGRVLRREKGNIIACNYSPVTLFPEP